MIGDALFKRGVWKVELVALWFEGLQANTLQTPFDSIPAKVTSICQNANLLWETFKL